MIKRKVVPDKSIELIKNIAARKVLVDEISFDNKDDFIPKLIDYYSFQGSKGKQATIQTMQALFDGVKKNPILENISPFRSEIRINDNLKDSCIRIYSDILAHLGVDTEKGITEEALRRVIQDIKRHLYSGNSIEDKTVNNWIAQIRSFHTGPYKEKINDILINIEQIQHLQQKKSSKSNKLKVKMTISGDIVEIINAGEAPYKTCQRISEPTGFNKNGEPLFRAINRNIFIANIENGSGHVLGRSILELVKDHRDNTVLLVERRYLSREVSRSAFDNILEMMLNENYIDIDYIVLADNSSSHIARLILAKGLSMDFHRDTFRSAIVYGKPLAYRSRGDEKNTWI